MIQNQQGLIILLTSLLTTYLPNEVAFSQRTPPLHLYVLHIGSVVFITSPFIHIHLSIHLSIHPSNPLSFQPSTVPLFLSPSSVPPASIRLSVHPPIHPPSHHLFAVHLFICPPIHSFTCAPISLPIYLPPVLRPGKPERPDVKSMVWAHVTQSLGSSTSFLFKLGKCPHLSESQYPFLDNGNTGAGLRGSGTF